MRCSRRRGRRRTSTAARAVARSSASASTSQARPQTWTPMMPARARGDASTRPVPGSRLCVRGSTSQKTGVISCHCSAWAVATKVKEGTITSPFQAQRPDRDLQGDGRVAHGDAVADAEVVGEPGLEVADEGARVGQPPSVEEIRDPFEHELLGADVRPPHMERLRERRMAPEDREVTERLLCTHDGLSSSWRAGVPSRRSTHRPRPLAVAPTRFALRLSWYTAQSATMPAVHNGRRGQPVRAAMQPTQPRSAADREWPPVAMP